MSVGLEKMPVITAEDNLALRPPWAIAEWAFASHCDGCKACVDACLESVLRVGADGRPETDFRFGGCDFCGACVASCERGALRQNGSAKTPAFRFVLSISSSCLALAGEPCRTCEECCDSYAIRFGSDEKHGSMPVVLANNCNGCGACVGPCPTGSISLTRPPLPR